MVGIRVIAHWQMTRFYVVPPTPMVIPTFSPARLLIRPKSRRRMIFKTVPPNFLIVFVLDVYIHLASFLIYYQMPIISQLPL